MNRIFIFLTVILGFFISGCTTYSITYECELDKVQNNKLSFEDQNYSFDFFPTYNGIYFIIKNKTNQSATLEWDKTYFTQPDGNTYHALNTDTIDIPEKAISKIPYESIIPPNGIIARFTTGLNRMYNIEIDTINKISNYYGNVYKNSQGIQVTGKSSELTRIEHENFVVIESYWPHEITLENLKSNNTKLFKLAEYIKNNDSIKFGFFIKSNNISKEYNFIISINKINIVDKTIVDVRDDTGNLIRSSKGAVQTEVKTIIIFTADKSKNYQWE